MPSDNFGRSRLLATRSSDLVVIGDTHFARQYAALPAANDDSEALRILVATEAAYLGFRELAHLLRVMRDCVEIALFNHRDFYK